MFVLHTNQPTEQPTGNHHGVRLSFIRKLINDLKLLTSCFQQRKNSSTFPRQHVGLVCCHGWCCANTRQLHTDIKQPTDQHGGSGLRAFCVAAVTSAWKQPLSLGVGNSALPLPHVVFFRGQTTVALIGRPERQRTPGSGFPTASPARLTGREKNKEGITGGDREAGRFNITQHNSNTTVQAVTTTTCRETHSSLSTQLGEEDGRLSSRPHSASNKPHRLKSV